MTNVLIVDDEKIEREGLKYLLSREEGERNVFEASNGKQALQIIRSEDIQLVLTDIKMPHMDGLELSRRAKEENPALQIIIFSGYSDFTFAQEAIRYGVTEYILKPVNPEDFHKVIQKAEKVIEQRKKKESREIKEKNFLQQYFLQNYLYSGKLETLEKAKDIINLEKWNGWHCGILLESDVAFFDTAEETLEEEIQKELRRVCFYLNLNARQSLLLFQDVYCDYQLVANHLYNFMKRKYRDSFYLAVSRKFEGCECLPEILEQLEQQMEEKFYHPEKHVFSNENDVLKLSVGEVQDSQIMQMISEDITRKDTDQLRKHFACLKEKYHDNTQYSAMYIKFVFSNVIQELFQENQFSGERRLEHEIERLYIFGMEECRWTEAKNDMPLYDVTFPYIRMMAGQVDFTPGAMRNGTRDNWKAIYTKPISMGTRCHQAACYIVQDSPFTMLADTPTNYEADEPYTRYIASLPVVFDKTIVPQGEIGKYIVTARKKGNDWYVGGQSNWDEPPRATAPWACEAATPS